MLLILVRARSDRLLMDVLQVLSLHAKGRVVALQNDVENSTSVWVTLDISHAITKVVKGVVESVQNSLRVGRAASNVIGRVVRVNDGEAVGVAVRKGRDRRLDKMRDQPRVSQVKDESKPVTGKQGRKGFD